MHGFKSAILAIFHFCQNDTFEPVHEIPVCRKAFLFFFFDHFFFREKTFFYYVEKLFFYGLDNLF